MLSLTLHTIGLGYSCVQDNQRIELETQRDDILTRNANDKDDMLNRHAQEKTELEEELAATCRDRDDSLMFAENEKQQVYFTSIFGCRNSLRL